MSVRAYVALGSNLGDRHAALAFARASIDALPGTRVVAASAVEETVPFGVLDQPAFLNQMLAVETELAPDALLDALHVIERAHGRTRASEQRWGPRVLDCDIVLFDDVSLDSARLTIPHPGLPTRDFWQRELGQLGVAPFASTHAV